jgi:hypothetical protein
VSANGEKNLYIMPKYEEFKDWSDNGALDFDIRVEWANYKTMQVGGNYNSISNTEYYNYSEYAQYNVGHSQAYGRSYNDMHNNPYPSVREGKI